VTVSLKVHYYISPHKVCVCTIIVINVDQQSDEPWPLLILDHDDKEHNIVMRPGDMVLYESAKLLHGRPSEFLGSHYDNIFAHYKPITGWDYAWAN
jgi:hypothetical protein